MKRILVVDDTEQTRALLGSLMSIPGAESHLAPDVAGALAALEKRLNELENAGGRDALRRSREQFEKLLQFSPLGAALYSADDGRLMEVNARFLELIQCRREDVIGRTGGELGIWCDPAAHKRFLDAVRRNEHVHAFEARLRGLQGREYDMLLSAQRIELPEGAVVMVKAHDISDLKRAEAASREKDQLLRQVIDLVPHFIFAKDIRSRFLFVNQAAAAVTGLKPDELVGLSDLDFPRDPAEAEAFMRDDREVIASGRPKFVAEERLTDAAGRVRIHETMKIPFVAPGTGEPALLGVAMDITDRKRAEDELRIAHQRLTVMSDLTREMADCATPRAAALLILHAARKLIDWDCSWLQLWNEEKQKFTELAGFDILDGECRETPPDPIVLWDPTPMVRRVMQHGPQLLLRQNETDQIEGFRVTANPRRSLSLMFAPIRHADRLIGMVSIQSYRKDAYDPAALDLLQTLASHCAGALARIQSTEALVESGERFRLLFEGANDAIFWADAQTGLLTHCNHSAELLAGRTRAELVGQPQLFLHPPEEADRYQEMFRAHASASLKTPLEVEVLRKDGQRIPVSISPSVTTIGGRSVIQGIFRDISARRRMESSLRLTQFSIDRAADSVFWVAPNSEILYVNDVACRTLGYSREELVGNTVPGIDPNFPAEAWPAHWEEVKTRKTFTFESAHQRKDGSTIMTEVTVNYLEFEGQEYNCATMRDVTDRKQAEERLAVMRFCVEHAGDSVSWVGPDARILYVNDAFCEGRGFSRDELLGMRVFDLDPDFPRGVWGPHWEELKQRGTLTFESRHRAKDGRVFPVEINANYVHIGEQEFNFASVRDITERKRAEGALRESEARLNAIVHQTPNVAMQGYDIQGRVRLWNEASARMFGWSASEAMGRTLDQLIHTREETEAFVEILRGIAGTGKSVGPAEYHFKRRNGEAAWCISTIFEIPGFSGEPMFVCMDVDITERKRAESRLETFSELGRKLGAAETAREAGAIIADTADRLLGWDACVLDLNASVEGLIQGVVRKDTINGVKVDVPGRINDRTVTPRMRRVYEHGAELELRQEPFAMAPESVPIGDVSRPSRSLMAVPIRDRSRPIGVLSIQSYKSNAYTPADLELLQSLADHCSGALNRLRAEEEARQLADFPRLNPNPVLELNARATVNYFNESAARLAAEMGVPHPSQMLPPETPDIVRTCLANGQSHQRLEVPSGKRVVSWSFYPIPGRDVVHCYAGDVTERRQLEAQLRQAQKMEAIGTLAGGIAHDFNNILGAILGNVELAILETDSIHPVAENLTEIRNASTRARDLVRQILSFSRQEAEDKRVVNLRTIIEEDLRLLRATLPATVELEFHPSPHVPDVTADRTRFHQVLLNLCTNAWHAMEGQPGKISLTLDRIELTTETARRHADLAPGLYARLTVKDNGKGMDATVLERIFDPFFTTKETGKGTGLGLSVVHSVMKNHRGAILVSSQPGLGTTVETYFPALREPEGSLGDIKAGQSAAGRGQAQRIVCLDDENAMLTVMTRLLNRQGYQTTGFTDVPGALAALRAEPGAFDLLITDHNMPGTNGLEVVREARSIQPGLPVILISGFINDKLRDDARAAHIGQLLSKPFQSEELLQAVSQSLSGKRPA